MKPYQRASVLRAAMSPIVLAGYAWAFAAAAWRTGSARGEARLRTTFWVGERL